MHCQRFLHTSLQPLALAALLLISVGRALAIPTETVLYHFQNGLDGAQPSASLIADRFGNLYGTTSSGGAYNYGTVFQMSPPASPGGAWTETVLYSFQNGTDGAFPFAALIFESAGNLYGTTTGGGLQPDCSGCGTVFELARPSTANGQWTETILYSFDGADGNLPYASLLFDDDGNLFGTTRAGGVNFEGSVFELSPPDAGNASATWKERTLYSFTGGADGALIQSNLVRDKMGRLYGTALLGGAYGFGAVFQLTRPSTKRSSWTETVLYSFTGGNDGAQPFAGLVLDPQGRLYGTTSGGGISNCPAGGCGTIFQLSPPTSSRGAWSENTLYSFTSGPDGATPLASLVLDSYGQLYGTASAGGPSSLNRFAGCGTVFRLTPPLSRHGHWIETTLHGFTDFPDGASPSANLILTIGGGLYGTTQSGGDSLGDGIVFQIVP
jgi:uncharacterized repeat protein (TIGR03803 family)